MRAAGFNICIKLRKQRSDFFDNAGAIMSSCGYNQML
jgi:hypothetical protein